MSGPVLPGVIRQIGYIVQDFDKTMETWVELGVGPCYVLRGITQTGVYRGEHCTVTLTIGFANSGDLQIELIHADDDAHRSTPNSPRPAATAITNWPTGRRTSTRRWRRGGPRGGRWCGPVGMRSGAVRVLRAAARTRDDHRADGADPRDDRDGELVRSASDATEATRSGC